MRKRYLCRWLLAAVAADHSRASAGSPGAHQRNPLRQRRHRCRRSRRGLRARGHGSHRLAGRALQRQRRRLVRHAERCPASCPRPADARACVVLDYPPTASRTARPMASRWWTPAARWSNSCRTKARSPRPTAPATGITSTDIGVIEDGHEPVGLSLARNAAGAWSGPATSTFGACNDDGDTAAARRSRQRHRHAGERHHQRGRAASR